MYIDKLNYNKDFNGTEDRSNYVLTRQKCPFSKISDYTLYSSDITGIVFPLTAVRPLSSTMTIIVKPCSQKIDPQ